MGRTKMKKSTKLWLYFIATMSIYGIMLGVTIPKLHLYSIGLPIFDEVPMFDMELIMNLLFDLREAGRAYYMNYQLPLDTLYIGLFAFSYYHILGHFIEKLQLKKWRFVVFLPIISAVFDFLENICIFQALRSFPEIPKTIHILPFLTSLKMAFGMAYLLVFFVLGIWVFIKKNLKNEHQF